MDNVTHTLLFYGIWVGCIQNSQGPFWKKKCREASQSGHLGFPMSECGITLLWGIIKKFFSLLLFKGELLRTCRKATFDQLKNTTVLQPLIGHAKKILWNDDSFRCAIPKILKPLLIEQILDLLLNKCIQNIILAFHSYFIDFIHPIAAVKKHAKHFCSLASFRVQVWWTLTWKIISLFSWKKDWK